MALLFGAGFAVVLVVGLVGLRMVRSDALRDWDVEDIALLRDEAKKETRVGLLDGLTRRIAPRLARLIGPRLVAELRRRIDLAGRPEGMTVDSFLQLVTKYLIFLGAAAFSLILMGSWLGALAALAGIVVLPLSRLIGEQRVRQARIEEDLPDFLDVLAVTVSAGIGFRSALGRVTERFDGPLREEMLHTLHQLDVGVSRRQAFRALGERTESESMSSFVSAFLQAEELGAPLADTLLTIAADMRRTAAQNARRKAARTVPKATLVMTTTMLPPLLILVAVGFYLGSGVDLGDIFGG